jgi:protein PhnA
MAVCDLCGSDVNVSEYQVKPKEDKVNLCETCLTQIESGNLDENHFNCLNDSMWSETPAVKVLSYRLLKKLGRNDMLDMMYLEEDEQAWADYEEEVLKDSNGNILKDGDSVTVIKDLEVKGAGKTVKRGTTVKNIRMCDVAGHVSCKVDGIGSIYLKAEFLKKL